MVRAQTSIEFIVGVSIMTVIYVLAIGVYSYYTENNVIGDAYAEHVCYRFSEGIDAAVIGGNGFSINITIPSKVYTDEVSLIRISNNYTATVEWEGGITSCSILTNNITAMPVYPGKVSATNLNGKTYVTTIKINQSNYYPGESALISAQYIKGADATITISYSNGTVLAGPITLIASNNTITYTWNTSGFSKGLYTINVRDNSYSTLTAERAVELI